MSATIEAKELSRYFGDIKAVDGVSFSAKEGDVLGFLGPNGAGKTTTMRMLTCFLAPTRGTATVGGYDINSQSKEVRSVVGYLPENAPLYGEMDVGDFLAFVAEVRGVPKTSIKNSIERVVEMTSLKEVFYQRIETLSKGYKRRVGLAQALIHDPKILILDEPTDGLDPNQKHEVRCLINGMAREKCIILSTHILEEVEEVCNRVVIIAGGKVVVDSTPDKLRERSKVHGAVSVSLELNGMGSVADKLRALPGVTEIQESKAQDGCVRYVMYSKDSPALLKKLIHEAETKQWKIDDLRIEKGKLDEVFRSITKGQGVERK